MTKKYVNGDALLKPSFFGQLHCEYTEETIAQKTGNAPVSMRTKLIKYILHK